MLFAVLLLTTRGISSILAAAVATPSSQSSSSSCSNSTDLHSRMSKALDENGQPTRELSSLRGTVDDVLTEDECHFLLHAIPDAKYIPGSGYNSQQYGDTSKAPPNVAGLELKTLSNAKTGFDTMEQYQRYLTIREKVRAETERSLGLCPGALRVDFTHLSQKTKGGLHTAHADNCFYAFGDGQQTQNHDNEKKEQRRQHNDDDSSGSRSRTVHTPTKSVLHCDRKKKHPFSTRVAASIVYINDHSSFGGGEFYWADHTTGRPELIVEPKPGRMAYFSSGVENLHGALPVEDVVVGDRRDKEDSDKNNLSVCRGDHDDDDNGDKNICPEATRSASASASASTTLFPPRRVYLAMWYVPDTERGEVVPQYRSWDDKYDTNVAADPGTPTKMFDIPVVSMKRGGLKVTLSFFLLALQNEPTRGTWRFVQQDNAPLGMVFKDASAMFSIELRGDAISVERHTDYGKRASLHYQLQESIALHKALDELHALAFGSGDDDQDITEENRLLLLDSEEVIKEARKKLPARRA